MPASNDYQTTPYLAEFYDHVVPYRDRQDVAFFVEMAQASGGPVLEVGCGTGRILLPTARTGLTITGLDLSAEMLHVCHSRLAEEAADVQARVKLVQADMRHFGLEERFALVTTPFRSFQHMLTVDDQLSALANMRDHLVDGGRLILDVFDPWLPYLADEARLGEFGEEPPFTMPDGRSVIRKARILSRDYHRQIQEVELIHDVTYPDGHQDRQSQIFPMRYLFRYEVEHLLVRAGFSIEALYADYDRNPYGTQNPGELIFVAQKA